MNRSSWCFSAIAALIFTATAFPNPYALASGNRTFTGEVGDAMCGRKHMEDEPSAKCTRASVAHGSKFALIVGDKIVARGEVVLVNGNFGLRVTEVASPRKRLESIRCLF